MVSPEVGLDEAAGDENLTQKERMEKRSGDEESASHRCLDGKMQDASERPDHFSHSQVKSLRGPMQAHATGFVPRKERTGLLKARVGKRAPRKLKNGAEA